MRVLLTAEGYEMLAQDQGSTPGAPRGVVGLGGSAGALEALEQFLTNMPETSGLAFVVVQHLNRKSESKLAELLARHTAMSVEEARDGARLEADHVYVIAPNTTLTLEHGALRTAEAPAEGLRLPIDAFFRSLATELGERATGVVLSGTGADGTAGLGAIRARGGATLAQAPKTARYEGMPASAIGAGVVDHVLPVEAMATRLLDRRRRTRLSDEEALDAEIASNLRNLCGALRQRTGHDFGRYKEGTLVRRIRRRVLLSHSPSVAEYLRRLEEDTEEPERLLKDLLIGVTQFFRDPTAFEAVAAEVLPAIFDHRAPSTPVRIWVPGCASGEEAYSLAILVREHTASTKDDRPVQIFATDIDAEQLARARRGYYSGEIRSQMTAARLERFFTPHVGGYVVTKDLREICFFSSHSLVRDPPFSSIDLISCRNVLIYLAPDLQNALIPLFHYGLLPGGFLFLGPSEGLGVHSELFSTVDKGQHIYRRSEGAERPALGLPLAGRRGTRAGLAIAGGPTAPSGADRWGQTFERIVLTEYAPAALVVDPRGVIRYAAGRTGRYLQVPPGVPSTEVFQMLPGALGLELRAALARSAKTNRKVVREDVPVEVDGRWSRLLLTVRPLPGVPADGRLYIVVLQEMTQALEPAGAEPEAAHDGELPAVERLTAELNTTRADLQVAMEDLTVANEELRSSNEELLSINEELQSANEELRTAQEDMQSVNEELQSVNAELRERIEEAVRANTELQNLYASAEIATVFLDRELHIARFTPAARTLLHLRDTDIGRPATDLATRFLNEHLMADADSSLHTGAAFERLVHTVEGEWFMKRVRPYRTLDGRITAVGVTFVDVTTLKHAEQALGESEARFRTIANSIPQLAWFARADGSVEWYNDRWYAYTGTTPEDMAGWGWQRVHDPDVLPRVLERWRASLATGEAFDMEFPLRRADGTFRRFLTRVLPLKDAEGRVAQWFGTNTDITEIVEMRDALTESRERHRESAERLQEADQRKNEFLAVLSHELRNPLAPVRNSIYILDRVEPGSEQARRAVSVIERQVGHMTRLIDDLLDVTRISRGKVQLRKERLDLNALLSRAAEDHRSVFTASQVALSVALPAETLVVDGDPTRLAQVVGNLLQNAAKFTPRGGQTLLTVAHEGREAVVRVRDSGPGLGPEMLSRLFEPFAQADNTLDRSKGGLGLGLALVKGLVEMHGGTAAAESDGPDRGAEFIVRLPLAEVATLPTPRARTPVHSPHRVLIIEDSLDAADSLKEVLELGDRDVAVAHDGPEGIAKVRELHPEVVLCDIGLPGMDGYEVARTIRADETLSDVHLIALSGYALPEDLARAQEAGFERHLAKPLSPEVLEDILGALPTRAP